MEDTLRVLFLIVRKWRSLRLNPCFNGRYSLSITIACIRSSALVLILVLMEDTLRAHRTKLSKCSKES